MKYLEKKLLLLFFSSFAICNAQYTQIPDAAFENSLILKGYDNVIDGKVLTANIQNITDLDVWSDNINDLSGIEDFTSLKTLECAENNLTSLDVSNLVNLEYLDCEYNQISSLDLSNNLLIEEVWASGNEITNIDLSNNPNLWSLLIDDNNLTGIDLSQVPSLAQLWIDYNDLKELNVSQNNYIDEIFTGDNPNLSYINVKTGNNQFFYEFDATNIAENACVQVDNVQFSNNSPNWYINGTTSYSENCALSTENFKDNFETSIYPNPTADILTIKSNVSLYKIELFDISGRKILVQENSNKSQTEINLSNLNNDIYILKLTSGNSTHTERIIKR